MGRWVVIFFTRITGRQERRHISGEGHYILRTVESGVVGGYSHEANCPWGCNKQEPRGEERGWAWKFICSDKRDV